MQLSQNQEICSEFFPAFSKSTESLEHFEQEDDLQRLFISKNYRLQKAGLFKNLKSPVPEHLWTANMLKGPKHFLNLHSSIFLIFFDHSERE